MECEMGKPDAGIIKAADGSVRERVRKMLRQIPLSPREPVFTLQAKRAPELNRVAVEVE